MPTDLFQAQRPPTDVLPLRFDFGAARQAAAALRTMADTVDRSARLRAQDARNIETGWQGGQQARFVRAETQLDSDASTLVRRLRDAADKLHDAAASATAENSRRARRLTEWRADLDAARERETAALAASRK